VSLLLARMTLRKRWTEHGRVKLLARAGISVAPLERPHFRSLVVVFGAVAVCMLAASGASSYAKTAAEIAQGLVMVSTMFVIGVICAVYPKQFFAFANSDIRRRPPYLFFFIAGFVAAALAFVVGLVFRLIRFQDGEAALQNAWQNSPWLILTFTLAFTLAILVQDACGVKDRRHDLLRSVRDALVLGIALGLAMIVVTTLLSITRPDFDVAGYRLLIMGLGLGSFIGFFIPKRFRTIYSVTPQLREELRRSHHDGRLADAWRFMKGATP
jgi:succinate dehydrogenase hydrophobic anchor subunit